MTEIALKMALVVTVPVIIGMIIRRLAENFVTNNFNLINKITTMLFAIVFLAILIEEKDRIFIFLAQAGVAVLILNVVMMTLAFYIAKAFATGVSQRKSISLECGLQNGTLAIFVATQIVTDVTYLYPTAAYAVIQYVTGFILIFYFRKNLN
jgi:BASS family bile acid:Na+ symporter